MTSIATGYRQKRKSYLRLSALGVWGGLLLLLLDMTTPFPTPARGAFAMWWLLVIGAGAVMWVMLRRLPLEATLQLAEVSKGVLTVPAVSRAMGLPLDMAETTLDALCECDQAEKVNTGRSTAWIFMNTNHGNPRLMMALKLASEEGQTPSPQMLMESDIARDFEEAEGILDYLARKKYVKKWQGPAEDTQTPLGAL